MLEDTTTTLAKVLSVVGIALFIYAAAIAPYLLRRFIDVEKIKALNYEGKIFQSIAPPLKVLTDTGVKIWWSRWIALGVSMMSIFASYKLFESVL